MHIQQPRNWQRGREGGGGVSSRDLMPTQQAFKCVMGFKYICRGPSKPEDGQASVAISRTTKNPDQPFFVST